MPRLHPLGGRRDHEIGGADDVRRRAVVLDQVAGARRIFLLEAADERHGRAGEGIDVLVVVPDRHEAEPAVGVLQRPARHGGDERVFLRTDILILVHQNPAVSLEQRLALGLGLRAGEAVALQQRDRLAHDLVEAAGIGQLTGGLRAESLVAVGKLFLIWLLVLLAGATASHLIARTGLRRGIKPWAPP